MLAVAYRDAEAARETEIGASLGAVAREPGAVALALAGLSEGDVGRLMSAVGRRAAVRRCRGRGAQRARTGNPLFVAEMSRLGVRRGAARRACAR